MERELKQACFVAGVLEWHVSTLRVQGIEAAKRDAASTMWPRFILRALVRAPPNIAAVKTMDALHIASSVPKLCQEGDLGLVHPGFPLPPEAKHRPCQGSASQEVDTEHQNLE